MTASWTPDLIPDLTGTNAIVTGATSGLGKQTARVLAQKGAEVILAVRNTDKGEAVAKELRDENPAAKLTIEALDLADLTSIRGFAARMQALPRLDLMVNNAGVMVPPFGHTKDGFELQMGTNHLGHFALTGLMLPKLQATKGSRLVVLSSIAHKFGRIDLDDLNWASRAYKANRAYADSKQANLLFMTELVRRLEGQGPHVTAAHPGWTATELQRHSGPADFLNRFFAQSVEMGTQPTLRAAFDPEARNGAYFGPAKRFETVGPPMPAPIRPEARDAATAARLWTLSEELTGVTYDLKHPAHTAA